MLVTMRGERLVDWQRLTERAFVDVIRMPQSSDGLGPG